MKGLSVCQEIQEEPQDSDWIGYNTMIRFKEAQDVSKGIVESEPVHNGHGTTGVEGWSTARQQDPDSEDELAASDDSWGSVVDTGVEALQQLMQGK